MCLATDTAGPRTRSSAHSRKLGLGFSPAEGIASHSPAAQTTFSHHHPARARLRLHKHPPASQFLPEEMEFRYIRTIVMVCAAYAANVLENALTTLGHEARERAFAQVDEMLAEYSQWPFARRPGGSGGVGANLGQVINDEVNNAKDKELQLEVSCGRTPLDLTWMLTPFARWWLRA